MSDESKIRSVDDLIVQEEAVKLGNPISEIPKKEEKESKESKSEEYEGTEQDDDLEDDENREDKNKEEEESEEKKPDELESSQNTSTQDEVDEYGTKVGKKKLYTEEEVQRMIRDRLSRGKNAQTETQVQAAAKDFTPDPESTDSWETQLEDFIDATISKREQKAKDSEWRAREEAAQGEFEVKFTQGMGKYKDFEATVSNKPITNAMMLATRSMNDPAAFIYAAAKQHPKELERIAQIQDPLAQGVEMGRLEERMKKSRNLPSSPKPAKVITGDASNSLPQLDIDARIAQHAKTKIMR